MDMCGCVLFPVLGWKGKLQELLDADLRMPNDDESMIAVNADPGELDPGAAIAGPSNPRLGSVRDQRRRHKTREPSWI